MYDSWPYPNTEEWKKYSGGKFLGRFANKWTSNACNQLVEVYLDAFTSPSGFGKFDGGCRWRHDAVTNMRLASVFKLNTSTVMERVQGDNIRLRVATVTDASSNPNSAGLVVDAADTCGDEYCEGCCTTNASKSPSKVLVDMEKNTLKALIPGISGFTPTQITYSGTTAQYQGAPFNVKDIKDYPPTVCFKVAA